MAERKETKTQTIPVDVRPLVRTSEMEIQTEEQDDDEGNSSRASTLVPPTPLAKPRLLPLPTVGPEELPPAYEEKHQQQEREEEWRVLSKWHPGVSLPIPSDSTLTGRAGPSSRNGADNGEDREENAEEEWKAIKHALGVECLVIDKLLASAPTPKGKKRRSGRFYNIYNTYVYGSSKHASSGSGSGGIGGVGPFVTQAALAAGASALLLLALAPYLAPSYGSVPGGPTYYDRGAWGAFNSLGGGGEGFPGAAAYYGGGGHGWGGAGYGNGYGWDGTDGGVWEFLGRVGRGAVGRVRGWPT